MLTIWKFPLKLVDEQIIEFPRVITKENHGVEGLWRCPISQVLHVDVQHGVPTLWAMVTPGAPIRKSRIKIRGTGTNCSDIQEDMCAYIGTFMMHGGDLVFHVFFEHMTNGEQK